MTLIRGTLPPFREEDKRFVEYTRLKQESTQAVMQAIAPFPKKELQDYPYKKTKNFADENKLSLEKNEQLFLNALSDEIYHPFQEEVKIDFHVIPKWVKSLMGLSFVADKVPEAFYSMLLIANSHNLDKALFAKYLLYPILKTAPSEEEKNFFEVLTLLYGRLDNETKDDRDLPRYLADLKKAWEKLHFLSNVNADSLKKVNKESLIYFLYQSHVSVTLAELEPDNQKKYLQSVRSLPKLCSQFLKNLYGTTRLFDIYDRLDWKLIRVLFARICSTLIYHYHSLITSPEKNIFFEVFVEIFLVYGCLFGSEFKKYVFNRAMMFFHPHLSLENGEYFLKIALNVYLNASISREQKSIEGYCEELINTKPSPIAVFFGNRILAECYAIYEDLSSLNKAKSFYEMAKKESVQLKLKYNQPRDLYKRLADLLLPVNSIEAGYLYKTALMIELEEGNISKALKIALFLKDNKEKFSTSLYKDLFKSIIEHPWKLNKIHLCSLKRFTDYFFNSQDHLMIQFLKKLIQELDTHFTNSKSSDLNYERVAIFYADRLETKHKDFIVTDSKEIITLARKHREAINKALLTCKNYYPSFEIFGSLKIKEVIGILQSLIRENCCAAMYMMIRQQCTVENRKMKLYLYAKIILCSTVDSAHYIKAMQDLKNVKEYSDPKEKKYIEYADMFLSIVQKAGTTTPLSNPDLFLAEHIPKDKIAHFQKIREKTMGKPKVSKTSYFKFQTKKTTPSEEKYQSLPPTP